MVLSEPLFQFLYLPLPAILTMCQYRWFASVGVVAISIVIFVLLDFVGQNTNESWHAIELLCYWLSKRKGIKHRFPSKVKQKRM